MLWFGAGGVKHVVEKGAFRAYWIGSTASGSVSRGESRGRRKIDKSLEFNQWCTFKARKTLFSIHFHVFVFFAVGATKLIDGVMFFGLLGLSDTTSSYKPKKSQSINQSINQSREHSTSQQRISMIMQSINQPTNKSIKQSSKRASINQSTD